MQEPWKKAKEEYQNQPLPPQLDMRVKQAIAQGQSPARKVRWGLKGLISFAAAAACFTLMMHVSPVFAQNVANLPVIGEFLRIVTGVQIDKEDANEVIHITLPKVENSGNAEFEKQINQRIEEELDHLSAEAREQAEELKEQAEGRTEPYNPVDFYADYHIHYNQGTLLSFSIDTTTTMASGYDQRYFFNLDLETGQELTLTEVIGQDKLEAADQQIRAQIEQRLAEDPSSFFDFSEEGGYSGLKADQKFYINENRQVVVVFDEYEIAPGSSGMPEFVLNLPLLK